jgi:hypothetical protein
MKEYLMRDGSKIMVEDGRVFPEVVYAMGEYHIGNGRPSKVYNATRADGNYKQFTRWDEAVMFCTQNDEVGL